jgi:hypothetical protein
MGRRVCAQEFEFRSRDDVIDATATVVEHVLTAPHISSVEVAFLIGTSFDPADRERSTLLVSGTFVTADQELADACAP